MNKTRRSHAPRGTLSREAIVNAAFELVASQGADALSMPGLARHLGVGVTSLYWYITNKDELLAAVAEQAASFLTLDNGDPSVGRWDELLVDHFREVRRKLVQHPGLGELVITHGLPGSPMPPGSGLAVTTHVRVESMMRAGMSRDSAVGGYMTVALYTLGYSAWSVAKSQRPERSTRRGGLLAGEVESASIEPSDQGFEFGLGLIVNALREQVRTAARSIAP